VKGQSCEHVLRQFKHAERVWAEVKYDGERTQIHVVIHPNGRSDITIFSKTGRNSTLDRLAVHDTIRRALGLPVGGADTWNTQGRKNIQNVVLEAEMVAFSNTRNQIDGECMLRHVQGISYVCISFVKSSGGSATSWPKPAGMPGRG
jgi:DNA ligase 4